MNSNSAVAISGRRGFEVTRGERTTPAGQTGHPSFVRRGASFVKPLLTCGPLQRAGLKSMLFKYRVRNFWNVWRGLWRVWVARVLGISNLCGAVYARVIRADGTVVDLGLISLRVVTDAGVAFIVDALHAAATIANMKYHGFGTGTVNEGVDDTALGTELTTEYATNNTRPTGSQTEGASADIYRTVGTLSPDATVAITEHGIFDQAANSGGTLLDRSKFAAINLVSGDSLQITYELTLTSGS